MCFFDGDSLHLSFWRLIKLRWRFYNALESSLCSGRRASSRTMEDVSWRVSDVLPLWSPMFIPGLAMESDPR